MLASCAARSPGGLSVLDASSSPSRLTSVSLSYAQQTSRAQDVERCTRCVRWPEHLDGIDWHVVLYSYMGVFPRTVAARSTAADSPACGATGPTIS
ncbi:methylaspartate mutase E subunit [Streptomyces laurentii]|uniref:Methylaspartate mutase E subunit n=1 Tax=Streptomyces laurentii TaxID=39478 RepID=A0A169PTX5_STRLU|nr:methylaspartate mutase E subunit [Streptomyces laurentii]